MHTLAKDDFCDVYQRDDDDDDLLRMICTHYVYTFLYLFKAPGSPL